MIAPFLSLMLAFSGGPVDFGLQELNKALEGAGLKGVPVEARVTGEGDPESFSMQLDELPHQGKTDPQSAMRPRRRFIQLEEHLEHVRQHLRGDPAAGVSHSDHDLLALALDTEPNLSARIHVLCRIG